jgi:hypothetical protein
VYQDRCFLLNTKLPNFVRNPDSPAHFVTFPRGKPTRFSTPWNACGTRSGLCSGSCSVLRHLIRFVLICGDFCYRSWFDRWLLLSFRHFLASGLGALEVSLFNVFEIQWASSPIWFDVLKCCCGTVCTIDINSLVVYDFLWFLRCLHILHLHWSFDSWHVGRFLMCWCWIFRSFPIDEFAISYEDLRERSFNFKSWFLLEVSQIAISSSWFSFTIKW